MIEENKHCEDEGGVDMDEKNCKTAAEDLGLEFWGHLTHSEYPKGCFNVSSSVYFNKHSVGKRRRFLNSICTNIGTT